MELGQRASSSEFGSDSIRYTRGESVSMIPSLLERGAWSMERGLWETSRYSGYKLWVCLHYDGMGLG